MTFVPLTVGVPTDVALTVTVPSETADRTPEVLMVAEPLPLMTLHTTALLLAFAGNTAADICKVPPITEIVDDDPAPDTTIELTGTDPGTVVSSDLHAAKVNANPIMRNRASSLVIPVFFLNTIVLFLLLKVISLSLLFTKLVSVYSLIFILSMLFA
jgi:hypothetical protein